MNNFDSPIDSRQLRAFVSVAHGGGLKVAAEELLVTESAISHVIRNLEESLGVKLFKRTGKGMFLTDAGTLLLQEAIPILTRMRGIRTRLAQTDDAVSGEIRLMVGTSFIRSALHDVLMEFALCFPKVQVKVTAGDRDSCVEALMKGEVDGAVLINLPPEVSSLKGVHLFSDELLLLMSREHKLAAYERVPLKALCHETVYMRRDKSFTTRIIEQEIARCSFQLSNVLYVGSFEARGELVRLGMGVVFQSPWAFRRGWEDQEFTWRRVAELDLRRQWFFAWSGHCIMDFRMSTLMRLCEKAGKRLAREQASFEAGGGMLTAMEIPATCVGSCAWVSLPA